MLSGKTVAILMGLATLPSLSLQLIAAYPGAPEPAVIQNRPVYPPDSAMPDVKVREQMTAIDKQIDDLLNSREQLQAKADTAGKNAEAIMTDAWQHYQQQIDQQQKLQQQLQKLDDDIQVLVKKKSKLSERLKK